MNQRKKKKKKRLTFFSENRTGIVKGFFLPPNFSLTGNSWLLKQVFHQKFQRNFFDPWAKSYCKAWYLSHWSRVTISIVGLEQEISSLPLFKLKRKGLVRKQVQGNQTEPFLGNLCCEYHLRRSVVDKHFINSLPTLIDQRKNQHTFNSWGEFSSEVLVCDPAYDDKYNVNSLPNTFLCAFKIVPLPEKQHFEDEINTEKTQSLKHFFTF